MILRLPYITDEDGEKVTLSKKEWKGYFWTFIVLTVLISLCFLGSLLVPNGVAAVLIIILAFFLMFFQALLGCVCIVHRNDLRT